MSLSVTILLSTFLFRSFFVIVGRVSVGVGGGGVSLAPGVGGRGARPARSGIGDSRPSYLDR